MKVFLIILCFVIVAVALYFKFKKNEEAAAPRATESQSAVQDDHHKATTVYGRALEHSRNTATDANDQHNADIEKALQGM